MRKDWIARELTTEIIVGAFIVMVFLGLGYFTIILSRETWFGTKHELEVVFSHAMGLREGDTVVVRGMPVGTVNKLTLEDDGVHAMSMLDAQIPFREDYKVAVVQSSVLGGRHIEIWEGSEERPRMPPDSVLRGEEPYDLMSDAGELVSAVKKGIIEEGIIDNLKGSVDLLNDIVTRVKAGEGSLGKFLADDGKLYEDLAASVASLRTVTERIEKGEGLVGGLMSPDDQTYKDFAATVASLRSMAEKLESGEGVLGRAVADDSLYLEVEAAIRELRAWIDDTRETSPVVSFTSILFGAF